MPLQYTYTDLQKHLTELMMDPERSKHCKQRPLCRTLGDNVCDLVTVTRFNSTMNEMKNRKGSAEVQVHACILVNARGLYMSCVCDKDKM